jgi:hypothetical protein
LVAAVAAKVYHVNISADDQSQIVNIVLDAFQGAATLFAIYGRVAATKQVTLTGSPPAAVLVVAVAIGLVLGTPAFAQSRPLPPPAPRPAVTADSKLSVMEAIKSGHKVTKAQATNDPIGVLQGIIASAVLADVQAALADANAQTPPDTIGSACWGAIATFVNSNPSLNPLPNGLGAAQLIQKARDLAAITAQLNSPTGPLAPLKIGCGPLIIDTPTELAGIVNNGAGFIAILGGMLGVVGL